MKTKITVVIVALVMLLAGGLYFYFRYYFTYEQKNILQRRLETITGQNITVTVFGFDGRIIKRWPNVKKISSGIGERNLTYTFFYTSDGKYVQIPNSVWYIAEEE
jgi:hypothetical protein